MESAGAISDWVVQVHFPWPLIATPVQLGMATPLSVKLTVPVGAGVSTGLELTVAVNVTDWSTLEVGCTDDEMIVEVVSLLTVSEAPEPGPDVAVA
jgi:hypothetical protein